MAQVTLKGVHKIFDRTEVVHGIDLDIAHNEFVVLVGPSGCGKSTTLRMIAGLEWVTEGEIFIDDRLVNNLPPKDRDIAMVFQNYALYPHMSVFENMSFGLKLRKYPTAEIQQRVEEAADILNIHDLLERRPKQLSGGQRQRVAMGRAIVRHPQVFLFDEPLSNLDAKLRVQMRTEIKKLHQKVKTTVIYVTHDQVEAMTLADRTVVMDEGKIVQVGPPQELYDNPVNKFVAGFIGSPAMNFIPCKVVGDNRKISLELTGKMKFDVPGKLAGAYKPYLGREMICGLRPEHITDKRTQGKGSNMANFDAKVEVVEPMGVDTMINITINKADVWARVDPHAAKAYGQTINLSAHLDHLHLIDPETELVI